MMAGMRIVPRRWHNETWVCSIRGHVAPAVLAARLRDEDHTLGQTLEDGTRVCRCLRCDLWIRCPAPDPGDEAYEVVPPLHELDLPRRGKPLEDAILLRLIAIDRGFHSVLFASLALVLLVVEVRLPRIQEWAQSLADDLNGAVDNSARGGSHAFLDRQITRLADLQSGEVKVLLITASIYAVIEGVEAVYLWKERRWAEYLTVFATVGFIPFEVRELVDRVTVLRVLALVANLAILVWLVYAKRLFGVRGGAAALEEGIDWPSILASPVSPEHTPTRQAAPS